LVEQFQSLSGVSLVAGLHKVSKNKAGPQVPSGGVWEKKKKRSMKVLSHRKRPLKKAGWEAGGKEVQNCEKYG